MRPYSRHRRYDPQGAAEIWQARYDAAISAFLSGVISLDVFGAQLYSLGFRGAEIQSEINLHWPKSNHSNQSRA